MVSITLDHSAMIFYHRQPVIQRLRELEDKGDVRLYSAITLDHELEELSRDEMKLYHRLREMVFGREQRDMNLTEHGDIVLLINHMKSKRDFFLTLEKDKYGKVEKSRKIKVRFPDKGFLKEIRGMKKKPVKARKR